MAYEDRDPHSQRDDFDAAGSAGRQQVPETRTRSVADERSAASPQARQGEPRPAEPEKRSVVELFKQSALAWWNDNGPRLGAALAYYAVFSIAPILVFALMVVGMVYGDQAARGELSNRMQEVMGPQAADAVESMIAASQRSGGGPIATVLSLAALLFGASGAFAELQSALNLIWRVQPKPDSGWWQTIKNRGLTFIMVLFIGLLFLALLVASSVLTAAQQLLGNDFPLSGPLMQGLNLLVLLVIVTVLFAVIFRYLPDASIAWRDVWLGAFVTAVLFGIGNWLISLYLGSSAIQSGVAAAGSLVVFLLWAYYSAQILYFGAEFTNVYARMYGSHKQPEEGAQRIPAAPA